MSATKLNYSISCVNPHRQYISIELEFLCDANSKTYVQLPSWRPGRYELGNFAKNVKCFTVKNELGKDLKFKKLAKDLWEINAIDSTKISVSYQYYAWEINAGSTYLDPGQLYVNPVNCFMYPTHLVDEPISVEINLPKDYEIATSLSHRKDFADNNSCKITFSADNYDQLADSPFICSASLQHNFYEINSIRFHLWFQGDANINWEVLLNDFYIFTNEQLLLFKTFPEKEYHFIFQILPYHFYHGVEHLNSTVIALGPGNKLFKKELYHELLGVSCHELFHAWNIKKIRPKDMLPYDFTKENYSRLGFIYEGITTYYGDYLLYRSGVFSEYDYLKTFQEQLQKHFDNFGRHNYSVASSSFDTWLDGYVKGAPDRKVSIYTEGCLISFLIDIRIRKATKNKSSLDDVMRILYNDFGQKNSGYTLEDIAEILNKITGENWETFINDYVLGTAPMIHDLRKSLEYLGYNLEFIPSPNIWESALGLKAELVNGGQYSVVSIYPNSVADLAGIAIGDRIVAINSMELKADWNEMFSLISGNKFSLHIFSKGKLKEIPVEVGNPEYYSLPKIELKSNLTAEQKENHNNWSNRK